MYWASTHGRSQLKHQNLRVGGYTEKLLKQINYISMQGPTPDVKLDAMGLNRLASFVRPCFVEASPTVEKNVSCIKCSAVTGSTQISLCRRRTVRTRPWTGVCKALMPDVMVPQVHQNNHSYVS